MTIQILNKISSFDLIDYYNPGRNIARNNYLDMKNKNMKKILWIPLLSLALAACVKDKQEGECRLSHYRNYGNQGMPGADLSLHYNSEGQITVMERPSGLQSQISYFTDSVVSIEGLNHTTYFLNAAGLADSSKTRYSEPNPNLLSHAAYYSYNSDGYLVFSRSIFSQLFNGSIIKDTTEHSYTVSSGNVTSMKTGTHEIRFIYSDKIAKNNPFLPPFRAVHTGLSIMGKNSLNLVAREETPSGEVLTSYDYQLHGNGNVTRLFQTYSVGHRRFHEYVYDCD